MTALDASLDPSLQPPIEQEDRSPVAVSSGEGGSILSRAVAAFLQPANIKWLLVAGVLILLASSLMLVGAHWHGYAPTWKYLILLGYAGGVGLAGRIAIRRLLLPRTGGVLMALAVLLMPITFLGLNLVGRTGPPQSKLVWTALLALNAAIAFVISRIACRHFLRREQPTFLAAHLLLAAAGAFVTSDLPLIAAAPAPLICWAVFAVGAIKVNRHCFWLVEERRLPRILGFLPVLLLGAQFLMLCILGPARHLPLAWGGFGLVLVAAVLLATADAVAKVFQQRTGDLVRPIPWPIIAPIVLGVALTFAGLILSGISDAIPYRPYALVPTAIVATALMALAARRTGLKTFVWAALLIATAAYNFSPVFFADVARAVVSQGAQAVSESRLPLAFYGLTYLPLLAGLLLVGGIARRKGSALVTLPVREFSFALASLLLAAAFGHPKATLPVAAAMTAVFALHAAVFSDRRSAWAATIAFMAAAYGLPAFARGVLQVDLPLVSAEFLSVTAAASVLLLLAGPVDRRVARLAHPARLRHLPISESPCRNISTGAAAILAALWVMIAPSSALTPLYWTAAAAIALLLMTQAILWMRQELAIAGIIFTQIVVGWFTSVLSLPVGEVLSILTIVVLSQSAVALALRRLLPTLRITRVMEPALRHIASVEMYALLIGIHLPANWLVALGAGDWLAAGLQPSPIVSAILIGWGCDVARRAASRTLAAVCCVEILGLAGAAANTLTGSVTWLVPTLAATSLLCIAFSYVITRGSSVDSFPAIRTFAQVAAAPLAVAMVQALTTFTASAQIAGVVAVAGLLIASRIAGFDRRLQWVALVTLNWQAILLVLVGASGGAATSLADLSVGTMVPAALPVAAVAAASLLIWELVSRRVPSVFCQFHQAVLGWAIVLALLLSLKLPAMNASDMLLAGMSFAILIGINLRLACRKQNESHAWLAIAFLFASAVYFVVQKVIPIGHGWSLYVPMAAAALFQCITLVTKHHPSAAVLDRPFRQTAVVLPLATVAVGLVRHLSGQQAAWLGSGSLALLLAAGFYFWRGLERRDNRMHVLAAAIVNVALGLLWRELQLTDPQFYLVPIGATVLLLVLALRREIPVGYRDPLRYAGALMILVSPTFHIVGGSWIHLLSLMLLSLAVMLSGIGLRVRALLYTGAAFLAADLVAIVVRGGIDQPNLLWLAGLAVGAGVITLAALAERHRENLLQRLRTLSATLAQWQ